MTDSNENMIERSSGKTTIAPGVLLTISRLAALAVPGVADMAAVPGGVNRLFRRGAGDGVRIEVNGDQVSVDIYLILEGDTNAREVSREVQKEVARSIEENVGMQVERINIQIENIRYEEDLE